MVLPMYRNIKHQAINQLILIGMLKIEYSLLKNDCRSWTHKAETGRSPRQVHRFYLVQPKYANQLYTQCVYIYIKSCVCIYRYIDIYTYVDIIGTKLSQMYFQGSNAQFLSTCPGIQRPPRFSFGTKDDDPHLCYHWDAILELQEVFVIKNIVLSGAREMEPTAVDS